MEEGREPTSEKGSGAGGRQGSAVGNESQVSAGCAVYATLLTLLRPVTRVPPTPSYKDGTGAPRPEVQGLP